MNPVVGVLFHWLGGFASGSFYVPYRGVKLWAWETYWLASLSQFDPPEPRFLQSKQGQAFLFQWHPEPECVWARPTLFSGG